MEPDCYLVEVLHYLNPHLIWVKVSDGSPDGQLLEQIGVYGVLPMQLVVDIESDEVESQRCAAWQQAAAMVMRKVFLEATQVMFQPIHIDRRSSIFDSNIHKYGEILITKSDGRKRKLSAYLKKSNLAMYDEVAFYQELSSGRLSTKLSKDTVDAVMKKIETNLCDNDSEVSLKKQTTVYQTAKKLEALTTDNVDRHNQMVKCKKMIDSKDVLNVLERKFKDLELCKDVEEKSVGRAARRSKVHVEEKVGKVEAKSRIEKLLNKNVLLKVRSEVKEAEIEANVKQNTKDVTDGISVEISDELVACRRTDDSQHFRRHNTHKAKSPKSNLPEINVLKEKYISFSPPGVDKRKLPVKVVPIHQETFGPPKEEKVEEELLQTNDDMFAKVDSEVSISITNKEVLEKHLKTAESKAPQVIPQTSRDLESQFLSDDSSNVTQATTKSSILQKKLKIYNETLKTQNRESSNSDTSNSKTKSDSNIYLTSKKNNVNPFKNVDPNLSVFVDKLVSPVLMVHTKNNARIEPMSTLSEIPFNTNIHNALKNMNVQRPMTLQSVSWFSVLRGQSVFLIGPQGSGKTMGYLPAVCRLVSDADSDIVNSVGPTCVIVCATARSVAEVEYKCRMFLGPKDRMFSCYAGMDMQSVATSLLNGCDLFICTPRVLALLMQQTDFGLDLRRLTTFVFDDCERLDSVYRNEIKVVLFKIKEMLKTRANKIVKVQYVLASRVWCDFMQPIARKAPNTVVCIGAFQECVLYSKANTSVDFVKAANKHAKVLEFLKNNKRNKKTVILCREDKEVDDLERVLKRMEYVVFACNSEMTVEDLRKLNEEWNEYVEPLSGPILVCCDGNLSHMNVTDAHYLIHYSMPKLYSMFCKRFCTLNDHYPSIFKTTNEDIAVKIILEDGNAEQFPKICNFVKRCTNAFPKKLDEICQEILNRKDAVKAENHVSICGNLLTLGECPDFWSCRERHTSSETYDVPKDWVPTEGIINFKILHYQTATLYSARLLANIKKGSAEKYSQTYSTLSLKMGMYFSQERNRKLHGIPKVGDMCAASVKQNFFLRCQVVGILDRYKTGNPNNVLVKLIDEEHLETSRDIYLYHLPKELREIETHVVQVRLAGIIPRDKDVTFSDLAMAQLKKAVENNDDLYMRGKVVLTVGNIIFVENVDVCQDLSSMNEVVVKNNFKDLLEPHSEAFPEHIDTLKRCLCGKTSNTSADTEVTNFDEIEDVTPVHELPKPRWAQLKQEDMSLVYFTSAIDPDTVFVRLSEFEDAIYTLGQDIDKYTAEKPAPLTDIKVNDIVLAKYPDDDCYERARIDAIEAKKAKCFFVDHGDWKDVPLHQLTEIPEEFVTRLPFQAIECRLIGIQPVGEDWTDFSTNWLCDTCDGENMRKLYVKFFSSDKAKHTGGTKYAVALIDTNGDNTVVYNNVMIDLNLAAPKDDEFDILNNFDFMTSTDDNQEPSEIDDDWEKPAANDKSSWLSKPIRSVPLVGDDSDDSDRWSINMPHDFIDMIKNPPKYTGPNNTDSKIPKQAKATVVEIPEPKPQTKSPDTSDVSSVHIGMESAMSDYEVVAPLKTKELDSDDLSTIGSQLSKSELLPEVNKGRKPKLMWKQTKSTVTIKIMLLGVEDYDLEILDRSVSFSTNVYDTEYNFKIDLYSIVKKTDSSHSNKGPYILVKLEKVMKRNWLSLTKGSEATKWIVYDVDSIDTSSDEEELQDNRKEIFKHLQNDDSDSGDEFCDDADFNYKRR